MITHWKETLQETRGNVAAAARSVYWRPGCKPSPPHLSTVLQLLPLYTIFEGAEGQMEGSCPSRFIALPMTSAGAQSGPNLEWAWKSNLIILFILFLSCPSSKSIQGGEIHILHCSLCFQVNLRDRDWLKINQVSYIAQWGFQYLPLFLVWQRNPYNTLVLLALAIMLYWCLDALPQNAFSYENKYMLFVKVGGVGVSAGDLWRRRMLKFLKIIPKLIYWERIILPQFWIRPRGVYSSEK